jgi:hypothetical protein
MGLRISFWFLKQGVLLQICASSRFKGIDLKHKIYCTKIAFEPMLNKAKSIGIQKCLLSKVFPYLKVKQ